MFVKKENEDPQKTAPHLDGVPETLLIPLWARAVEQSHPRPLIVDPHAARIVAMLDYDFAQFERKRVETENFCVRSRVIDQVVSEILTLNPGTPVIEFGPGLDTRFQRIGHLASSWLEVDLPEVISLRNQFFDPHPDRSVVSGSMLETDWMNSCRVSDTPPLFIAEGVFYFFSHDQIRRLLSGIRTRHPGSSFVFDAISPVYLKLSNLWHPLTDSSLQFALSPGASEIVGWDAEWSVKNYVGYGDSPWYDSVMHRFAWWKRLAVRFLPIARHAFMIVHAQCSRNDGIDAETSPDEAKIFGTRTAP